MVMDGLMSFARASRQSMPAARREKVRRRRREGRRAEGGRRAKGELNQRLITQLWEFRKAGQLVCDKRATFNCAEKAAVGTNSSQNMWRRKDGRNPWVCRVVRRETSGAL